MEELQDFECLLVTSLILFHRDARRLIFSGMPAWHAEVLPLSRKQHQIYASQRPAVVNLLLSP
jgi:hypothetical protein